MLDGHSAYVAKSNGSVLAVKALPLDGEAALAGEISLATTHLLDDGNGTFAADGAAMSFGPASA